jgi:hypothetical protein
MKSRLIFLLIFITFILSCEKTKFENTGTITGADIAMCACCGGYFIEIEGTRYRFEKSELPTNFTFDDNQLPIVVELNWELKKEVCTSFNWIKISDIRKL